MGKYFKSYAGNKNWGEIRKRKKERKKERKRIFVFPPLMRISENGNAHENVMGNGHDMKVDTLILWYNVMIIIY